MTQQSAIITGSNGQDGYFVVEILRRHDIEPIMVPSASGIDLTNQQVVRDLISTARPDYLFHLAANSTVDHHQALPNHATIATGTLMLLEALRQSAPKCRVFLPGSAYQFKNAGLPIAEDHPREATSVYCAAREYSHELARVYRGLGLKVFWAYLFHHESPRRGPAHLSQKIAHAARHALPIEIRDPSVIKEWTWASDTMEAAWALVNQDAIWEVNIGTGIGHSIEEFMRLCFFRKGLDYRQYLQKTDNFSCESLTANPARIHSLGWRPRHDIEYLAEQMTK